MKNILVIAYPYAVQYGTIEVPDDIDDEVIREYIEENWDDIEFNKPELDYDGIDYDIDEA